VYEGLKNMKKLLIIDTNVLLHDPSSLEKFEDNDIVIPFAVIEELDTNKKKMDEVGRNARLVSRKLDDLRNLGNLAEGVPLPGGGTLKIEMNFRNAGKELMLDFDKYDNRILAVAYGLSKDRPTYLVTKDLNLRIKADVLKVKAEDYSNDKIDHHSLYENIKEVYIPQADFALLFKRGQLEYLQPTLTLYSNEFVVLKCCENSSQSALARYLNNTFYTLKYENETFFDLRARNKEQKFALELLRDPSIKIVALLGPAGTGKTLISLAAGLDQVADHSSYSSVLVTRPTIPVGEDIGFLPGDKDEKLRPWMQPIFDNLELMFHNSTKAEAKDHIQQLIGYGLLQLDCLTYIRGRSISNQFIICDEAQNLTLRQIKTLATRVGPGTKIVFTGDPEQIDNPYLDASSNGLSILADKLRDIEIAGHVTLFKGERSDVAELCARIL
jgi:PhoH-like ATPase